MKKLTVFFKPIRLRQLLTVLLAAVVLFVSTACNNGDVRGARPDNPPVQMGGSNNPYKSGGDTNTNYNLSPDPKVSGKANKSADLHIISNQLIATKETLYPGADKQSNRPAVEKALPKKTLEDFEKPRPGGLIQRESSIGDRVQDRLGTVKETFGEASEFVRESARKTGESALDRPATQAGRRQN